MSLKDNWDLSLYIQLENDNFLQGCIDFGQIVSSAKQVWIPLECNDQPSGLLNVYIRNLSNTGTDFLQLEVCFLNPSSMDHPGGNWDLGAQGNIQLQSCDLTLTPKKEPKLGQFSLTVSDSVKIHHASNFLSIHQASSGGEAWESSNHIDRTGRNNLPFRGYCIRADEKTSTGNRATPLLTAQTPDTAIGVAIRDFWQNFPIKLEATSEKVAIRLLTSEGSTLTELQGGEQKTFEVAFEQSTHNEFPLLRDWLRNSDSPNAERIEETRSKIPYFTKRTSDSDERYESLVNLAIEGDDNFFTKREMIDEYGWRHYGDVWGDHEAVYHRGDSPMISHYNNQYDCTLGFAIQYLRTGDRRWWDLMIPMADHAWDIDTYHATDDKLLYNGGLFWHTYHYADAHTATHRSYPKQLHRVDSFEDGKDLGSMGKTGDQLTKNYQVGGGPAASHNYSTGWMLAYQLTGKERYKEAAINAANYVLGLEDGTKTPFKWLHRGNTGYSTCSSDGYYGPGRASANSTHALLTGHELTGDERYLSRAAEMMRRTVHPNQDLDQLDLLNAELRWFYTMYLQALCRFLDYKMTLNQKDADFRYGVASLRHYARWMVKHERATLSHSEQLQYPTETWAAQDMRKWHVLEHAARYESNDAIRVKLSQKADFFYDYAVDYLNASKTRTLCRPVILMLNFGWQRKWLVQQRGKPAFTEEIHEEFGQPIRFIPQRTIAIKRFKRLAVIGFISFVTLIILLLWKLLQS